MAKPEPTDLLEIKPVSLLYTKDELRDLAQGHVLTITFTKADGTERVMECTLRKDLLPQANTDISGVLSEQKNRRENNMVMAIWDLEKTGWRSFRLDSLKKVEVN